MRKKLKVVIAAATLYIQEEKVQQSESKWVLHGKRTMMKNRKTLQQRGHQIKNG